MKSNEQITQVESFLNQVVIEEIGKLQQVELSYVQFVIMGQAIEVLGGFLDHKPMKAKGQSAKRFSQGVNYLFGGRYRLLNDNNYLYDKLRNQMTHTFIPGKDLLLLNKADNPQHYKHLDQTEDKLVLIAEVFYQDICSACRKLITALKDGRIEPKNIAFGHDE